MLEKVLVSSLIPLCKFRGFGFSLRINQWTHVLYQGALEHLGLIECLQEYSRSNHEDICKARNFSNKCYDVVYRACPQDHFV